MKPIIAITAGDVAGVGPEVILRALADAHVLSVCNPLLIGHVETFRKAAKLFGLRVLLREYSNSLEHTHLHAAVVEAKMKGELLCVNPAGDSVLAAPRCCVSREAGDAASQYLAAAIELAKSSSVDAIVTAPLNKEALHLAGHDFPGHTEILADRCGVDQFAMMLHLPESAMQTWRRLVRPIQGTAPVSSVPAKLNGLSIAHVTLHTSVASVPGLLSTESVVSKIRLMDDFLQRIQCERRAIAVCALNPHGGENGLFGDEEAKVIEPAVVASRTSVKSVVGPLPVDTLVRRAVSGEFDGIVAMYHDQGHIPVKLIGFESAVNITLGLPIVRTSPTHGTAFDRAWNPQTPASALGMIEAIKIAAALAKKR